MIFIYPTESFDKLRTWLDQLPDQQDGNPSAVRAQNK